MLPNNPNKEETISIKQINEQVQNMRKTTKKTMQELKKTRQEMQTIKKVYEILFSDRYTKQIEDAFDSKIEVLEKIARRQKQSIEILKSERGLSAKNRIKIKLQDMKLKADEVLQKDALLSNLVKLETALDLLEAKKEELMKRANTKTSYNFEDMS